MAPGFLVVLSEPGTQVSLDEFHDWYNNEHIPTRLNHLSSFLSGARYQSTDVASQGKPDDSVAIGIKPSWLAAYEIDDTKTFKDESYTVLREKRSEREKDVIGRLEVLDRRTCEVVREVGEAGRSRGRSRTTGLRVGNPSRWVVTHGMGARPLPIGRIDDNREGGEIVKWLNEVMTMLQTHSDMGGWVKTRVLKVLESAKTRNGLSDTEKPLSHFIFHEFVSEESASSPIFRQIIEQNCESSSLQISEFRRWELHKSYPCIAQGSVQKV